MYHLMEQCVDDDRLLHIVSDADANEEIRQSHLAPHSFSYETESSEKGTGIAQHYIDRLQLAFKALIIEECELLLQIFYCWAHCESRFIVFFTQLAQVANRLLISNKISINKNKQIYFFLFFLYFSLLIFYTSPRQWGLRGYLLLAKVDVFIECKVTAIIPYLQALLSARYKKTFRKTMIIGLLSVPLSLIKKRFLHS